MILTVAAPAQGLAACALETETGRVHENQVELRQQVAPMGEQLLLHHVLHAARGERRAAVLLLFRQLLAQPPHGSIVVMQFELVDAGDGVILTPPIGGAIGAAHEQPVQHGEEHRAFQRKAVLALAASSVITARQPVSSHSRSNTSAGPMRRTAIVVAASSLAALNTMAFAAKRAPERNNRSCWPLACNSSKRPSVAITC